jgi:type II secretory pathway pseudopilin PulG
LVVIGIIAVLIGILMPALGRAQRAAKMTTCLSNQHQLVLALMMYCQDNHGYFPGGAGTAGVRDDQGNALGAQPTTWLARYNPDAYNPYACNDDEQAGPVFLSKYVSKSKKIPACPEEPFLRPQGSFWPNNYWTGYWYPMSLVYKPDDIWTGAAGPSINQEPQKLSNVKYPSHKCVIIDRKTHHSKRVVDTDKTEDQTQNNTKKEKTLFVTAGFADGHVAFRGIYEMYDSDVNWTGRFRKANKDTWAAGRAGILWKDFE